MIYSVLISLIMLIIDVISLMIMIHSLDLQKKELNLMKAGMADPKEKTTTAKT